MRYVGVGPFHAGGFAIVSNFCMSWTTYGIILICFTFCLIYRRCAVWWIVLYFCLIYFSYICIHVCSRPYRKNGVNGINRFKARPCNNKAEEQTSFRRFER